MNTLWVEKTAQKKRKEEYEAAFGRETVSARKELCTQTPNGGHRGRQEETDPACQVIVSSCH